MRHQVRARPDTGPRKAEKSSRGWVLDLVVHTPDLPLSGDASTKLGLGLWNNAPLTFLLEAAVLLGGLGLYLRATAPKPGSRLGHFGMAHRRRASIPRVGRW